MGSSTETLNQYELTHVIIDNEPKTINLRYIGQLSVPAKIMTFYKDDKFNCYVKVVQEQEKESWYRFTSLNELREVTDCYRWALDAFANAMLQRVH